MAELLNFIQPIGVLMKHYSNTVALFIVFAVLVFSPAWVSLPVQTSKPSALIPVTFLPLAPSDIPSLNHTVSVAASEAPAFPSLSQFVASVTSPGQEVVGVYVPQRMALRVVQQPAGNSEFVAPIPNAVTQFEPAAEFGALGLLAHNNLAGENFQYLGAGDRTAIVYGDGTIREFQVTMIRHFQALNPNDPFSDFLDIDNGGGQLSSTDVFNQVYTQKDTVVFQTCIAKGASRSWGRLFVIASAAAQD